MLLKIGRFGGLEERTSTGSLLQGDISQPPFRSVFLYRFSRPDSSAGLGAFGRREIGRKSDKTSKFGKGRWKTPKAARLKFFPEQSTYSPYSPDELAENRKGLSAL